MKRTALARLATLTLVLVSLAWSRPAQAATGWHVGLQAGHWRSHELPDELRSLRGNTGAAAGGVREFEVNLDIAQRTAAYLRLAGVTVDVLPATVPPNYVADAFVSLHADGNASTRLTGFKIASHYREWAASTALADALRADYGPASGLRWDGEHISSGMRGYYAMSSHRFKHTISSYTPGVILEMGYLTNPNDRRLMTQQADKLARAVSDGILRFLHSKPEGGWPAPPPLPELRATVVTATANIRSGPGAKFSIVRVVNRHRILFVTEVRGEWLKLHSYRQRPGERWIHRDMVKVERISDDPPQDS